jgi:DNA invertase Pin-like site-specific DNA recombinase
MRSSNGEIIGERTCDKMSAARRKGKWVGGGVVSGAVNCSSNTGWGCAGINRHVVGDERALQERRSESILTLSLAAAAAR